MREAQGLQVGLHATLIFEIERISVQEKKRVSILDGLVKSRKPKKMSC
ncbi:MAG: hypothetical protein KG012_00970 [Deltaproteobacteria bacterium]|nr:hypothetical protein [Deltaproteobacteria bacterium]